MKLQRALLILFYIMNKETATTRELCEYLEVSKRTVYRDIEILKTAGVDIISIPGAGGGHRLSENFAFDKVLFNNEELQSILMASSFLTQFNNTSFAVTANEIVKKLQGLQTQKIRESHIAEERFLIDCKYSFHEEDYFDRLKLIENAVNNDLIVYLKYSSPLCERMSTTGYVAPYGIINKVGYWYLAGYCYELECYRIFNIAYIRNILLTQDKFQRTTDFNLKEFWKMQNIR